MPAAVAGADGWRVRAAGDDDVAGAESGRPWTRVLMRRWRCLARSALWSTALPRRAMLQSRSDSFTSVSSCTTKNKTTNNKRKEKEEEGVKPRTDSHAHGSTHLSVCMCVCVCVCVCVKARAHSLPPPFPSFVSSSSASSISLCFLFPLSPAHATTTLRLCFSLVPPPRRRGRPRSGISSPSCAPASPAHRA